MHSGQANQGQVRILAVELPFSLQYWILFTDILWRISESTLLSEIRLLFLVLQKGWYKVYSGFIKWIEGSPFYDFGIIFSCSGYIFKFSSLLVNSFSTSYWVNLLTLYFTSGPFYFWFLYILFYFNLVCIYCYIFFLLPRYSFTLFFPLIMLTMDLHLFIIPMVFFASFHQF